MNQQPSNHRPAHRGCALVTAMTNPLLGILVAAPAACFAQDARDWDPARNLALKKPVSFLPLPIYSLTAAGEVDAIDLTDGALSRRADQHI